ncbi:[acyl-carrier-protein] S-malonyltransferase [Aequitasia blattaphilus]|uniref:Malonyl CoA-acyl carrier protein transacylase n=1 Tax=Aequitasia blattaphilus TaxID=2949332 RepID=A0ABT1EA86_9FIRM|nr:ACP S-malonyltransferase [Aequitasia blattaphilus]MCP1101882.1 ACP S-malonyltransferase [Aequitasia blattaphilus]MCR8614522.1 ACP S-malonyltransferase [Aequitasia blattaphilus]
MSKIAFIYPGQGAQTPGMGKDFYENSQFAKDLYDRASKELDLDLKALCFEKNEKLDVTEYTQAALVVTCLAMTRVFMEKTGIKPDLTAGLSLGEYCAIAVAGGLEDVDAVKLVRKRGILMEHAYPSGEGAMAAILGLDAEKVNEAIKDIDGVSVANYNCPGQIVITGEKNSVQTGVDALKEAGAKRGILLNVSGPFHSPFLKEAGQELRKELDQTNFHELSIPYVTNVTADYVHDIKETRGLLERQVSDSVCWQQSMEKMIADGVDTFYEIGPGKTLNGFLRKINRDIKVINIAKWEDVENGIQ